MAGALWGFPVDPLFRQLSSATDEGGVNPGIKLVLSGKIKLPKETAAIGALVDLPGIEAGKKGTLVSRDAPEITFHGS